MTDSATSETIDAGFFGDWLQRASAALRSNVGMDVPCGDCVGCCTSHYSILLRPHDAALDIVPAAVLTGVSGLSYPHFKMNPRSDGTCPMFNQGRCDIYAHRPQTCLDYDCRVYAAAGLEAAADKPVINKRIRAWFFRYENDTARSQHAAIRAAALFLQQHAALFPAGWLPTAPAGLAVLAIKTHAAFLTAQPTNDDLTATVRAMLDAQRDFDIEICARTGDLPPIW